MPTSFSAISRLIVSQWIPDLWKDIVNSRGAKAERYRLVAGDACDSIAIGIFRNTRRPAGSNEKTTILSPRETSLKIQVKKYFKNYLTERKGHYPCQVYYVYLPKHLAEPFIGRNLKATPTKSGILLEPADN